MRWDAKIPYCGRKDCWSRLIETIDLEKVRERTSAPFGPRRHFGGSRGIHVNVRNWQGKYWNPFNETFQDHPVPSSMLDAEPLRPEETQDFMRACYEGCE